MKNIISFLIILILAVFSSACINNYAVQQLNEKAKDFSEKGELEEAASRLESSLDLDNGIFETHYNLAVIYIQMQKCDKAFEQIEQSFKISENEPSLYYLKGLAYTCQADEIKEEISEENQAKSDKYKEYLSEANSSFEQYLKLSPNAKEKEELQEKITSNNQIITDDISNGSLE